MLFKSFLEMMVNKFENDWFDYLISSTDKNRGFNFNPADEHCLLMMPILFQRYHQTAGDAHAEMIALNQAGDQAKDATLLIALGRVCIMVKLRRVLRRLFRRVSVVFCGL